MKQCTNTINSRTHTMRRGVAIPPPSYGEFVTAIEVAHVNGKRSFQIRKKSESRYYIFELMHYPQFIQETLTYQWFCKISVFKTYAMAISKLCKYIAERM